MAKKQKKDSRSKGLINWYKGSKWWVKALSVLLVFVLGIVGINIYQQINLEEKFNILDKEMSYLLDKTGVEYNKEKYCFHESVKFGGGSLKCKVEIKTKLINEQLINNVLENIRVQRSWQLLRPSISTHSTTEIESISTNIICRIATNGKSLDFYCSEKSKRSFYPYRD